jgi:hypothetical protein
MHRRRERGSASKKESTMMERPEPTRDGGGQASASPPNDPVTLPYIRDQLILAGPESQLSGLLKSDGLEEIHHLVLPQFAPGIASCVRGRMAGIARVEAILDRLLGTETSGPWIVAAVRILDGRTPAEWIADIAASNDAEDAELLADANYVIGDPHTAVGSPHTAVGTPAPGTASGPPRRNSRSSGPGTSRMGSASSR